MNWEDLRAEIRKQLCQVLHTASEWCAFRYRLAPIQAPAVVIIFVLLAKHCESSSSVVNMSLVPFLTRSGADISSWDPFESFLIAERSPARSLARDASAIASTKVDWLETPEAHIFKAELPGLKKEEIKVDIEDGNVLKISGERTKEEVKKTDKWHHVERSHGQFLRKIRLPKNVQLDQVSANVENGVLTVNIPKVTEKKPEVRSIDVSWS